MATYDYICSHMVTYAFFDFKLVMVTYGNIWYTNSYGHSHAKESYATIRGLTGASRQPRQHR